MPIYAFRCHACQADFEMLLSMSADTPACPVCQSADVKKQLSVTATPGKSEQRRREGRAAAAREGHFSNYSKAERKQAGV